MSDRQNPRARDPEVHRDSWREMVGPRSGGELSIQVGEPKARNSLQSQTRLDRAGIADIATRRRAANESARRQKGTDSAELLARCQQLRATHRCPGRCVFTGELRQRGIDAFRKSLGE
ncbi:hypothetical protein [Antrihabitans stalactiti]|uniref:Uncharacterized protein n=1 Tax=Antrihabitans stalactiti TaxID=2584121 RepID=A0A848KSB4_9NOCA|nr:hypothetical protein [Antrihabitans stalactiti]NMN98457.1 hypothetical protein [Antrihabitans stalactiti]